MHRDIECVGCSLFNFVVDDFDVFVILFCDWGYELSDIIDVNNGVCILLVVDFDGNIIILIGNFCEDY